MSTTENDVATTSGIPMFMREYCFVAAPTMMPGDVGFTVRDEFAQFAWNLVGNKLHFYVTADELQFMAMADGGRWHPVEVRRYSAQLTNARIMAVRMRRTS